MKKICIVTGSRAEYGLLRRVIAGIKKSLELDLMLIVTGMHLSRKFGHTCNEIEKDGFNIDRKIDLSISSDKSVSINNSIGIGLIEISKALKDLKPDILLLLGDRYEIFAAAVAATVCRIPIVHIHGGETTEGAFDESFRHSITKMSHVHFVASEEYRNRVIQLGEIPNKVILTGGLGVDIIANIKLLNRKDIEKSLEIKFLRRNLLITFHPVTLENNTGSFQMKAMLESLKELQDTLLIFTYPNSDTGFSKLIKMIEEFVSSKNNAVVFYSLGQLLYLSCIKYVDGVVGNSSSGLTEVPSFKKGTINIGERQKGRLKSESVIDCLPTKSSISVALSKLYSKEFQEKLVNARNPYGEGGATEIILNHLENMEKFNNIKKKFYDIPFH